MLSEPQGRSGRVENLVPQGFDPGPSSPYSVAIPTELPGPHLRLYDVEWYGESSALNWENVEERSSDLFLTFFLKISL